jgi:hypothetical protein
MNIHKHIIIESNAFFFIKMRTEIKSTGYTQFNANLIQHLISGFL